MQEPPKHCMKVGHEAVEAQFALRIDFVFSRRGFPNKTSTAWVGFFVCAQCATQEAADEIINGPESQLWQLAEAIRQAIHAQQVERRLTKCYWAPRKGADDDFARINKTQEAEKEKRAASLLDAANDTGDTRH